MVSLAEIQAALQSAELPITTAKIRRITFYGLKPIL